MSDPEGRAARLAKIQHRQFYWCGQGHHRKCELVDEDSRAICSCDCHTRINAILAAQAEEIAQFQRKLEIERVGGLAERSVVAELKIEIAEMSAANQQQMREAEADLVLRTRERDEARQERDKWLGLFNHSEQFQNGPTKQLAALQQAIGQLVARWQMDRTNAADNAERHRRAGVQDKSMTYWQGAENTIHRCADELAALVAPRVPQIQV